MREYLKEKTKIILSILIYLLLCFGVLAILHNLTLPNHTKMWLTISNTGHIPLFGILSLLIFGFMSKVIRNIKDVTTVYIITFITASLIGILSEFIQIFGSRDADIMDFVNDLIGIILFLVLYAFYDKKLVEFWENKSKKYRILFKILIFVLFLFSVFPISYLGIAYIYRNINFPMICNFESPLENEFRYLNNVNLEIVPFLNNWKKNKNGHIGKLTFLPAKYPGLEFDEPVPDWSQYEYFSFDIYSDLDSSIIVTIRIEDTLHDENYYDRFNRRLNIARGENKIQIQLKDIEMAPRCRTIKLSSIRSFMIFTGEIKTPISIYIDNIRLE